MSTSTLRKKAAAPSGSKKIKIQIGICKRLIKEVASYEKEVIENEAKVQKMRDEGKDIYDIRKQEEVLQESYMMIPDSNARCEEQILVLTNNLEEYETSDDVDNSLISEAKEVMATFTNK